MKKLLLAGAILFLAVWALAQTFSPPVFVLGPPIATTVAQCGTPTAHTGAWCPVEATAGVISYYLWNGSAWVLDNGAVVGGGVTSFNGRTGAVTTQAGDYTCAQVTNCPAPAPVLSVNGKTGNVVLSATTTATTTVQ